MALTRKFLSALGIEADKIDEIISAHTDTINGLKAERDSYKEDAEKLKTVQSDYEKLKAKVDPELQKKFDDLQSEYDSYKQSVEDEKILSKKKEAFKEIAKDANLSEKGIEKAMKYTDWNAIEIDSKGKIKDAKKHMDSLAEEWEEYVVKEGTKGAKTATPPSNTGGTMTKQEIMAIKDTVERQKAMAENHELFGI